MISKDHLVPSRVGQRVTRTTACSVIDGNAIGPKGTEHALLDPATNQQWGSAWVSPESVDAAITSARRTFEDGIWSDLEPGARAAVLRRVGELLVRDAANLAEFESLANGKPVAATTAEVTYAANWYRYLASALDTMQGYSVRLSASKGAAVVREPIGVVAAITPFNGALSLGTWKIAPALAMGNSVVVKPPVHAAMSSMVLAELLVEAGLPAGVLNVVVGDADEARQIADDHRVDLVSFTGSSEVARQLGSRVSARMGRFLCEAGGKSAHIIMDDADLDSAVIAAAQGVMSGSGQTCVAGSRLLVHESVADQFTEALIRQVDTIVVGDPYLPGTHLGPIGSQRQLARISGMVESAIGEGAVRLSTRGPSTAPPAGLDGGNWYYPTLLGNVNPQMEVCREEVFGPVAVISTIGSEEEAIAIANGVDYGLAAGVWTHSAARAHRISRRLHAGTIWVNTYRVIDWRVPFGGYKQSGIGRENGLDVLNEYSHVKSIVTDFAPAVDPFGILPTPINEGR